MSVGSQICGVKTDGALVCWGRPSGRNQPTPSPWDVQYREVCLAETVDSVQCDDLEPVGLANLEGTFSAITVARDSFCGIRTDGYLVCHGGSIGYRSLPPSGPITSLGISGGSVCGLQSHGTVACWLAPRADLPSGPFISLATDPWVCGLKSDGAVACHGDGSSDRGTIPRGPFTSISAGGGPSGQGLICGLKRDGTPECRDPADQLWTNLPEGPLSSISIGGHICGIRTDGAVSCRGHRYGDDEIPTGSFSMVSVGESHACGVRTDGAVECWGDDAYGQAYSPEGRFVSVGAGRRFSCGLRTDGTVSCWGETARR